VLEAKDGQVIGATFLPLALASPVDAAVCTRRTGVHHDDRDGGFYRRIWIEDSVCSNDAGAPIYAWTNGQIQIATMDTTSSWFLCYVEGTRTLVAIISGTTLKETAWLAIPSLTGGGICQRCTSTLLTIRETQGFLLARRWMDDM
jgi:hypothetical protein